MTHYYSFQKDPGTCSSENVQQYPGATYKDDVPPDSVTTCNKEVSTSQDSVTVCHNNFQKDLVSTHYFPQESVSNQTDNDSQYLGTTRDKIQKDSVTCHDGTVLQDFESSQINIIPHNPDTTVDCTLQKDAVTTLYVNVQNESASVHTSNAPQDSVSVSDKNFKKDTITTNYGNIHRESVSTQTCNDLQRPVTNQTSNNPQHTVITKTSIEPQYPITSFRSMFSHKCQVCGQKFTTSFKLQSHRRNCSDNLQIWNDNCSDLLQSQHKKCIEVLQCAESADVLDRDSKDCSDSSQFAPDDSFHECKICNLKFQTALQLKSHVKNICLVPERRKERTTKWGALKNAEGKAMICPESIFENIYKPSSSSVPLEYPKRVGRFISPYYIKTKRHKYSHIKIPKKYPVIISYGDGIQESASSQISNSLTMSDNCTGQDPLGFPNSDVLKVPVTTVNNYATEVPDPSCNNAVANNVIQDNYVAQDTYSTCDNLVTQDTDNTCNNLVIQDTDTACDYLVTQNTDSGCDYVIHETDSTCDNLVTQNTDSTCDYVIHETDSTCDNLVTQNTDSTCDYVIHETDSTCDNLVTQNTDSTCDYVIQETDSTCDNLVTQNTDSTCDYVIQETDSTCDNLVTQDTDSTYDNYQYLPYDEDAACDHFIAQNPEITSGNYVPLDPNCSHDNYVLQDSLTTSENYVIQDSDNSSDNCVLHDQSATCDSYGQQDPVDDNGLQDQERFYINSPQHLESSSDYKVPQEQVAKPINFVVPQYPFTTHLYNFPQDPVNVSRSEYFYKCKCCSLEFENAVKLLSHYKNCWGYLHYLKTKLYACPVCKSQFTTTSELQSHRDACSVKKLPEASSSGIFVMEKNKPVVVVRESAFNNLFKTMSGQCPNLKYKGKLASPYKVKVKKQTALSLKNVEVKTGNAIKQVVKIEQQGGVLEQKIKQEPIDECERIECGICGWCSPSHSELQQHFLKHEIPLVKEEKCDLEVMKEDK